MNYTIQNEYLTVVVASKGGELQSIKSVDGTEYLWQGDVNTWPDRALNIFPYVARLTNKTYEYKGKQYHMEPHGFVPASELEVAAQTEDCLTLGLAANEETRKCYPFEFQYLIHYELVENKLKITYEVENKGTERMYFGLGGHPGFIVPLEDGVSFDDYTLEFSAEAAPYQVGMSDTCFVTGKDKPYELRDGKYMDLSHSMFDNDAIILRDMCREVTLKSDKGTRGVRVTFPQMDYLGIWHWPRVEVDYVCIEPWTSLPSREGIVEDITKQDNLVKLDAGKLYKNEWTIEILN